LGIFQEISSRLDDVVVKHQAHPPVKEVEWMVRATGRSAPTVVIKAISEKGGTHTKKITLKK
jgi:hypothetical protein